MIYGYARVSSKVQLKGNSLEEQRLELKKNGCQDVVVEQFTGTTTARPKFERLVKKLKPGDTLVVCKLDRIARNVYEGISIIRQLFNLGVKVHVLNIGLLEDTALGKFFIQTLLAVAELERNMILERTTAGKEIARKKDGYREGRPPVPVQKINLAMELLGKYSYKQVADMTGISKSTLIRYRRKNKRQ